MKIAIFTDIFLSQLGGVSASIVNSALELDRRGHKLAIFNPKAPGKRGIKKYKFKNTKIYHLPSVSAEEIYPEWRLAFGGVFKIYRILKKFKPDIIHFHTPLFVGGIGIWLAKVFKKPLVGTCHIYFTEREYLRWVQDIVKNGSIFDLITELTEGYMKFSYRRADMVIVPSQMLIRSLIKNGWDKKKIVFIPNGVFEKTRVCGRPEKERLKKKYGLGERVIIFAGRLSKEKNLSVLLRAMKIVTKKEEETSLLLVGDGPSRETLEKESKDRGIGNKVIFAGRFPHEELIKSGILSTGDIFVLPSKMEVHPMAVIEAMACGLPIVAANAAGLSDIVSDNGFLVPPDKPAILAEKIILLLKNETLRKKMGQKSKTIFEKEYTIEKTTDKLEKVYRGLLLNRKAD